MKEVDIKRLEKFKKYYPKEYDNLVIIEEKLYIKLEKEFKYKITEWEFKNNKNNNKAS